MPPGSTPVHSAASARAAEDECVPTPRGPMTTGAAARVATESPVGPSQAPREPETKLTGLEQRILAFEARWWRASGAKTQAIADELDLTPERYYQYLARLVDHPEAAGEQPAVIRRLRAARDHRRRAR
ncbi:DUF3263 domain-containing protein [Glycomyces sp. L485]|uniref:DUF3263 domain-containing protein n=1 Tax=Glycomyces sp. L485 TaxID=2909235 RepID=UPI001F4B8DA9|nr:DUF3263 domain-containing protein [Glycomyces sp. L485]MCH7232121.1 DUF3263 domain-containing protein [Glycomyces sp. L485]